MISLSALNLRLLKPLIKPWVSIFLVDSVLASGRRESRVAGRILNEWFFT
jgi:hypothetical protein